MKRAGSQKAITAVAHAILRTIYVMLRDKVPYHELGPEYLGTQEKTVEYWVRKIQKLGYGVELTGISESA